MENVINSKRKWIILAILAAAGGIIYELPYLRYTYYKPLIEGLGLTNAEFGASMSMYGIIAMIFYLPGGWLADRFSHRKLIAFSLVGTGLGGFYLSTWPSYMGTMILFGFWGITTILTFWATMLKAVSMLGDESEQGRLFSFCEGGRGIVTSVVALSTLALFNALGGLTENFSYILWVYSTVCILVGVAAWFLMADNKPEQKVGANVLKDIIVILKMPITWILAVVIFSIYTTYTSSSYLTPYMTDVFGLSAVAAGVVATLRSHIFRPIAGGFAGTISKKVGSSIPVMQGVIAIAVICLLVMLLAPINGGLVFVISAVTVLIGFLIFMLRGLYFAPVGEVGTPVSLMGAAVGLISTIAFASDTFNFILLGNILDKNPGVAGYKYIFMYMIGLFVVAFIGLAVLSRVVKKVKAADNAK
ncbi:MAG: putative transporter [Bacillota bacterium]|jgi:sugar phosphate permease|nr:putative transporter [Bacillota bacterium]